MGTPSVMNLSRMGKHYHEHHSIQIYVGKTSGMVNTDCDDSCTCTEVFKSNRFNYIYEMEFKIETWKNEMSNF